MTSPLLRPAPNTENHRLRLDHISNAGNNKPSSGIQLGIKQSNMKRAHQSSLCRAAPVLVGLRAEVLPRRVEGDAAARADLLRAKVVDRHGAAHVAVEGERDVVLKWEKVMLEIPLLNIEGCTDQPSDIWRPRRPSSRSLRWPSGSRPLHLTDRRCPRRRPSRLPPPHPRARGSAIGGGNLA